MEVQQEFADQVTFIGVPSLSNNLGSMSEFVDDTGATAFEHVPDLDGEIWERFGVFEQRTYVYVNDDGSWELADYGSLREDVQALIDR